MLLACSENPRALSSKSNDAEGMGIVIEVRVCCIVGDSLIGIKSWWPEEISRSPNVKSHG